MPASTSCLNPLLSAFDFRLVCAKCCVKETEIAYTLKPVQHRCQRDLLLCKAKGGHKWRPVSRRPTFPNPRQYVVCRYYVEGFGCTQHRNRCTFARSAEEAAVWNFEKQQQLDHASVCDLVTREGSAPPQKTESLDGLLAGVQLQAACSLCCVQQKEITFVIHQVGHRCGRNLLLAKAKGSDRWRPVAEQPKFGNFGSNVVYQVCDFFVEGSGCTRHGMACTYARSREEAVVWNFVRDQKMDTAALIRALTESETHSATPQSTAEHLLQEFSGEFIELCNDCFHGRPQKITVKRWNDTCSADVSHTWTPVLVHHLSEGQGKHSYSQVRPLPQPCTFEYCSHVRQGKPCWHGAGRCQHAHSEVEMAVWKAEKEELSVRPHLLQASRKERRESAQVSLYCRVCLLVLSSPESFFKHCSSLEHAQLLSDDTTTRWRCRPPPHSRRAEFWLCDRPESCEYGSKCPRAHGEDELKEWLMRAAEEKEIRHSMEAQGLMSYAERLLQEYRGSSNEVHVISEQVDDVSISCDEDLTVECEESSVRLKWNFQVDTERELVHVALLKQEPGASFSLGDSDSVPCIYSPGEPFLSENMTYDLSVSFTCVNPGLYEQWLVLDFDMRPVLLRKLRVKVGQKSLADVEPLGVNGGNSFQSAERWHRGNRVIVPCSFRTEEQEELLKEYKPPQMNILYKASSSRQTPLNDENYKDRMHAFLYDEERAEDQVISRLNVSGEITMSDTLDMKHFCMKIAEHGELFCAVSIPCNLTAETSEGSVLRRSIQSSLIAPPSKERNAKVYEATVLRDSSSENKIYLQLSRKCCSDLRLKRNKSYGMEVQFQLNRHRFCTMHKAADLLPDTKRVLPDLKECAVPVNINRNLKLNAKQQSAIDFITGSLNVRKFVAPLLVYGPFGTGKTFTLAVAARELTKQRHNKVLICTYTNSSADLYVRDHLHPFIDQKNAGIRPIRIKANKQGTAFFATDEITLKYCLLSQDRNYFLPPTKAVLDLHNVVITTTQMARNFHNLNLPEGYFTHILIDEAAQMLECEALMPLGLAGPNTRVVLAGDHMQMAPKLFSVDAHRRSNHTLLSRLFHYYQSQKCDAAQKSRIIFSENYRSTKDIVEFVSTHFYVGTEDVIRAAGDIQAHPTGHALNFHHVRGECLLDTVSMTWFNKEEVAKVTETVQDVLQRWPSTWGTKDQSSICVLSEGFQVQQIRKALMKRNLVKVHVENIANVQGKQFRVIIMTAVQTHDSLKTAHVPGLELFSDARVLNTAMTRAQSQLVVVGDASALCCFGACSNIWKSYIQHCINNNSVTPEHFTCDFFEKDIKEIEKFQRSEDVEEVNANDDAILQQMRDEYEQLKNKYKSDEDSLESRLSYTDVNSELLKLCKKYPGTYKRGRFVRESLSRGYVIPFDSPSKHVMLHGKENLGKAFTGDEVVFEPPKDEDHSKPQQDFDDRFVRRTMIPLAKNAPILRILLMKKQRNFIPVWEQTDGEWSIVTRKRLDEYLKRSHVFVVQVLGWREECLYPLGRVVDILPIGRSVEDGLQLLKEEFKVAPAMFHLPCESDKYAKFRQDLQEIITFTVDPKGAKDLDDAVSVRDMGDQYELGVHIADVASFVLPGDALDEIAKERGVTFYCSVEEPSHMFPKHLSTEKFSLLPGQPRRVISLMFSVTKKTNQIIGTPEFQLSLIKSNRQLSYEEAEDIISSSNGEEPAFDTVEGCVAVAYSFAKAQRKKRLVQDWAYARPDDDRVPGKRKAHHMIEELSVLLNKHASETLIMSQKTSDCTPLRCQAKPDPEELEELKEKCGEFIPLSFHVRHRVDHDNRDPNTESFCVLTKVWKDIRSAAGRDDVDNMADLVAADDIHPQLMPVVSKFRKSCSKAYVIRSNSSPKAKIGHYSLNVTSYTNASSPIRRYMDLVLQRLLYAVICDADVQYSQRDVEMLSNQVEFKVKDAKEYEQKAEKICYAVSMRKQNASKIVFIVGAEPAGDSFAVSFPFNKNIFADSLSIMYKDLQLENQPDHDPETQCVTLKWRKRIYSATNMQIHQELTHFPDSDSCTVLPVETWKAIGEAIRRENWKDAKSLIMEANTRQLVRENILPVEAPEEEETDTPTCPDEEDHFVELDFQFQPGDTLQIQMTSEVRRCYHTPVVQLVHIKPKFEVCVDHVHNAITCFSRTADYPSRNEYRNTDEYKRIWSPLCETESASTAVDESSSIIIEDLVVNFQKEQQCVLTGSFVLPLDWIDRWAIECNLAKCLLCIRKRGLKLLSNPESSALVDPGEFTKVEFRVHHLPMESIPDCVYQKDTLFTVEIIPKLLPDIRKENAVISIESACDLVSSIALGKRIPIEQRPNSVERWQLVREEHPGGVTRFNKSQYDAVEKALNNPFTLIQGPPGTGKTVVGVYIVYWFSKMNSMYQRKFVDPKHENKKEVILYCGPSNKSVDVVAEFLMRYKSSLKLLRVYSQQVEMLEYPYPGCSLQFSSRTLRQELSKPELRSITLHHRMRENNNSPYSVQIKDFDHRIKLHLEKKGAALTAEEVTQYKKLLRDARTHELQRHDIILCTCTQSSTPSLTKTVSARQILIDECAMATEPQALIPLVCNKPEKIVLIGDHKQLRPIVKNEQVKKLGMAKSLFERYFTVQHKSRTEMLDTQYRMHEDICKFPSDEYYDGKLKTGVQQPNSVLLVNSKPSSIVFGHIRGKTVRLVVKTAKGNENSKVNMEERDQVIAIAKMLVERAKVDQQSIVILSPYNAQVSEIRKKLEDEKMDQILVTTITKSQGSEWRYVIISTVCSLPSTEIEKQPERAWLSKHLGFVGDPNQINVGITRAKEGLCIIGNEELLRCSSAWEKLLDHYTAHGVRTKAKKISVAG
ncbi:hypothetical protein LDENG_00054030 [Lucifuga dentata]|nr:hypothetical protein LDENG_00054030 [Lucifuga dentata]